jgi:hypothetical protein
MATSQLSEVIHHLRSMVLLRDGAGLTDEQLLEDYISRRDEAALAGLVQRHGPMVWSVCRRVLSNYHDAEDAFQATFLVLVRKAASIASRKLLANKKKWKTSIFPGFFAFPGWPAGLVWPCQACNGLYESLLLGRR